MPISEAKKKYLKDMGVSDEEIARIEADLAGKAKQAWHLESKEAQASITREEIVAAIQAAVAPFSGLSEAVAALQDGLKELKEAKEAEARAVVAATPAYPSLIEILKGGGRGAAGR